MNKIAMILTQALKFGGKVRKRGSRIEATPAEAKVLTALGRAEPETIHVERKEEPKKTAYKRRDIQPQAAVLVAETPWVATVQQVPKFDPADPSVDAFE